MATYTERESVIYRKGKMAAWSEMFDLWRVCYNQWPYQAHQKFYNMIFRTFPEQKKYDKERVVDAVTHALAALGRPVTVWELGGWDGALAKDIIAACGDGVTRWWNVEICQEAINHGWHDEDGIYCSVVPASWAWESPVGVAESDIAVLSHVIEHLSWADLQALLLTIERVPFLYIQTPPSMGYEPRDDQWMGTMSTHKLSVGWGRVSELLAERGYSEVWHKGECRFFTKTGAQQ